jgi:two-component system sensor histidine kinase DctS
MQSVVRPRGLWVTLCTVVLALMLLLVWLSGRYQSSRLQDQLDRDASEVVTELRRNLMRNIRPYKPCGPNPDGARLNVPWVGTTRLRGF